jgi:hypothetical protein
LKILKKLLLTFHLTAFAFAGEVQKLEQEIAAEESRMKQEETSFAQWKQGVNQKINLLSAKKKSLNKEQDSLEVSLKAAQKNVNNLRKKTIFYEKKVDQAGKSMIVLMDELGAKLSDKKYSDFGDLILKLKEKAALGSLKGDEGFSQIWKSLINEYQKGLEIEVFSGSFNPNNIGNSNENIYGKFLRFGGVLEIFVSEDGSRAFKKQYNEEGWIEESSKLMKKHLISVLEVASGNTIPKLVLLPIRLYSDSIVSNKVVQ